MTHAQDFGAPAPERSTMSDSINPTSNDEWEAALVDLLQSQHGLVDELGYVPLSQTGAELLFGVISQCYERGSTLVTSNLPFEEWTSGSDRS